MAFRCLASCLLAVTLPAAFGRGQDVEFPAGVLGQLYYASRIDLVPGGGLTVELDGVLDDEAWTLAPWQGWTYPSDRPRGDPQPPDFTPLDPEEDLEFSWAAVADDTFLYIAWRLADDVLRNVESFQCDAWNDDSVEVYIDALGDGPDCTDTGDHCYGVDDSQITVGLENLGREDPEELVFGGLGGGPACDFAGPHPELCQGVVRESSDPDTGDYAGWFGEIAVLLETAGNNGDGTPTWAIQPDHGTVIGFNIHGQDDDDGGGRDHKLMWSDKETAESSWRNPGVFGKLMFVDPTQEPPPLVDPVRIRRCRRLESGSVDVLWTNPQNADPEAPIVIIVDEVQVMTVPGTAVQVELTREQVPEDDEDHVIGVVNTSLIAATCTIVQAPFDECGGIRRWNILGAYDNPAGALPPLETIRRDYMTDGVVGETDFVWAPEATIQTAFGGPAASTSISGGPAGRNPGGVPTVFSRFGLAARVDFQAADVFGGNLDFVMAYAQCYVLAGEEREAFLRAASDDSIQVLLNGTEVHIKSIGRPGGSSCNPDDPPVPVTFREGVNNLVVKVFDGEFDWNFALRFEDALGGPFTEGLRISLTPPGEASRFVRGDTDASGTINLTDGIGVLNFLFRGAGIGCADAGDTDDSGSLNLTDGVAIFQWLFRGGRSPLPPAPTTASYPAEDCGPDPSADELGCDTRAEKCL